MNMNNISIFRMLVVFIIVYFGYEGVYPIRAIVYGVYVTSWFPVFAVGTFFRI